MMIPLCEHVDDYLLRDLSPEMEQAFHEHLADCDSCRLLVEQDRQIDGLLKKAANAIPCPLVSIPLLQKDQQQRWPQTGTKSVSLIAALLVLALWAGSILSRTPIEDTARNQPVADVFPAPVRTTTNEPHPEIAIVPPSSPVRVEFPKDILGLPIDTGEPDITLIQVFPVSNVNQTSP